MNEFFIETKEEFDKHWKNYKFIILFYDEDQSTHNDFLLNIKYLDKLKQKGFHIISTYDLTGELLSENSKNLIMDSFHPSSAAWEKLTPLFVKKLNQI